MQNNVKFVTDGSVVYHLAGNEWYAVTQDEDKVMLVDTDCKISTKKLWTWWSDGDYCSKEGESGQRILNYCNSIADTYFNDIKYAIEPRTVEAGTAGIENAIMWPMSKEEFEGNKVVGGKIVENSNDNVWTRTFNGIYSNRCAWYVYSTSGDLYGDYGVDGLFSVAPAFYLRKSTIDYITDDGEIVLKPENNID